MSKRFLLSSLLCMLFGFALADTVSNYTEDFERPLDTSDHAFAPSGWGHIVDAYDYYGYYQYYVEYEQKSTGGQSGAYLQAGKQTLGYSWSAYSATDLLVSPAVSGTVTFYLRDNGTSSSGTGALTVYRCAKADDGTFTAGETIDISVPELSKTEWTAVTISDVAEGTYLGFKLDGVDFDSFSATSADVIYLHKGKVTEAKANGETSVDANYKGVYSVNMDVTLKNIGDYSQQEGDEGYSLDVIDSRTGDVLGNYPMTAALQQDSSLTYNISAKYTASTEKIDTIPMSIRENLSGTVTAGPTYIVTPFKGIFRLTDAYNAPVDTATVQKFGASQKRVDRKYTIHNIGGARLKVTSIQLPEGYAKDLQGEVDLKAHSDTTLTITLTNDTPGRHQGKVQFLFNGLGTGSFLMPVDGTTVDSTLWYVDFESNAFPANVVQGDSWSIAQPSSYYNFTDNAYWAENTGSTKTRLISPLLSVEPGDSLVFTAAMKTTSGVMDIEYSADRLHWNTLHSITPDNEDEAWRFSSDNAGYYWNPAYAVMQYTLKDVPTGNYYLAFNGSQVCLDNIIGYRVKKENHSFVAISKDLPTTGTVNHAVKTTLTVKNATENADEATVNVVLNGKVVASSEKNTFKAGEQKTFELQYTPYESGAKEEYFSIVASDTTFTTLPDTIVVADEVAVKAVSVGTANTTTDNLPLQYKNRYSENATVYPAAAIGLKAGDKITHLAYKGYTTTSYGSMDKTADLKIYIANIDADTIAAPYALPDTANMTTVYNGSYTIPGANYGEDVERISIDLSTPFEYTGKGLSVFVKFTGKSADWYTVNHWDCDTTLNNNSVYRYNSYQEPTDDFTLQTSSPVLYLEASKEANTVSGKVSYADTSLPAANVKVNLTAGNVVYTGTTDSEGSYDIPVYQDTKVYNMDVRTSGYVPFKQIVSVADSSTVINIALQKANGLYIDAYSIPANATVNHEYKATATVLNPTTATVSDYKVQLLADGEPVAEIPAVALAADSSTTYTFSWYPHEAGKKLMSITIETADTANDSVAVAEDMALREAIVGTPSVLSSIALVNLGNNTNSLAEVIYTPAQLNLPAGTKIHRLFIKGTTGYYDSGSIDAKVWIANDDNTTLADAATMPDTAAMTKIGDSHITYSKNQGTAENTAEIVSIALDEPYIYNGGNLHVVVLSGCAYYPSFSWETDPNETAIGQYATSYTAYDAGGTISWNQFSALPVIHLDVEIVGSVSGMVTDSVDGSAIANAEVLLRNGGVEYSATTDDEGNYSMSVIQIDKPYEISVKAPKYVSYVDSLTFDEKDLTRDIRLARLSHTLSGVVKDSVKSTPIAGASVTIANADRTFTATTDADGAYSISIEADDFLKYAITATADGYAEYTDSVDLTDSNAVKDILLVDTLTTSISTVGNDNLSSNPSNIYDVDGRLVRRNAVSNEGLKPGVYVIRGKKVIIK